MIGESSLYKFMGRPMESCQPRATFENLEGELWSGEISKLLMSESCGVGLGYSGGRECINGDGWGAGDIDAVVAVGFTSTRRCSVK